MYQSHYSQDIKLFTQNIYSYRLIMLSTMTFIIKYQNIDKLIKKSIVYLTRKAITQLVTKQLIYTYMYI